MDELTKITDLQGNPIHFTNSFSFTATGKDSILTIAPGNNVITLICHLLAWMEEPYECVYIRLRPAGNPGLGLYQLNEPISRDQLIALLTEHHDFLERDARFLLKIKSKLSQSSINYNSGGIITTAGQFDDFLSILLDLGYTAGKPDLPGKLVYHCHPEFNQAEESFLSADLWAKFTVPTNANKSPRDNTWLMLVGFLSLVTLVILAIVKYYSGSWKHALVSAALTPVVITLGLFGFFVFRIIFLYWILGLYEGIAWVARHTLPASFRNWATTYEIPKAWIFGVPCVLIALAYFLANSRGKELIHISIVTLLVLVGSLTMIAWASSKLEKYKQRRFLQRFEKERRKSKV